jgi:hypothetical protein
MALANLLSHPLVGHTPIRSGDFKGRLRSAKILAAFSRSRSWQVMKKRFHGLTNGGEHCATHFLRLTRSCSRQLAQACVNS